MKRSIKHFIEDAIEYCDKAEIFVKNMTFEEFERDEKTFLAVSRALEIIGEALKNVPDKIKNKYLGIPWREIIGFRNTVAHAYFGINKKIVYNSAKEDTKYLKTILTEIISTLDDSQ